MQIPINFSATQAASIASVIASRDKISGVSTNSPAAVDGIQLPLEKSESASPDRDAQGQGDGLGHHSREPHGEKTIAVEESSSSIASPIDPDGPPPELLDLIC